MPLRVPTDCEYYPADATPPGMEEIVRQFAFQYGETYSSYLVTEDGWETFWCPERRGVVRFVRWCGYYALSVGGLLAPPEDQAYLLEHFQKFLALNRLTVMFMNVGRDQLAPFRQQKYQVTKSGEEPVVRLETATWQGKDFEWVRRQENFCKRQGLVLEEIKADPEDPVYKNEIAPELIAISDEHVAATVHGRELRYFVGRFTPFDMAHKRIFIARSPERIEAFIVCNPCLEGAMWAIEMYRRREDATRGVVPFAMLQTMRVLREEGVAYCSLSAIPMLRCDNPQKGDSLVVRGACYLWWRYGNFLYDMHGIYHFKSRFRPEYRENYVVAWPKASFLSVFGMGRTWGITKVSPWRLLRELVKLVMKSETRKTMAVPELRPDRILRRLLLRPKSAAPPAPTDVTTPPDPVASPRSERERQPAATGVEQSAP